MKTFLKRISKKCLNAFKSEGKNHTIFNQTNYKFSLQTNELQKFPFKRINHFQNQICNSIKYNLSNHVVIFNNNQDFQEFLIEILLPSIKINKSNIINNIIITRDDKESEECFTIIKRKIEGIKIIKLDGNTLLDNDFSTYDIIVISNKLFLSNEINLMHINSLIYTFSNMNAMKNFFKKIETFETIPTFIVRCIDDSDIMSIKLIMKDGYNFKIYHENQHSNLNFIFYKNLKKVLIDLKYLVEKYPSNYQCLIINDEKNFNYYEIRNIIVESDQKKANSNQNILQTKIIGRDNLTNLKSDEKFDVILVINNESISTVKKYESLLNKDNDLAHIISFIPSENQENFKEINYNEIIIPEESSVNENIFNKFFQNYEFEFKLADNTDDSRSIDLFKIELMKNGEMKEKILRDFFNTNYEYLVENNNNSKISQKVGYIMCIVKYFNEMDKNKFDIPKLLINKKYMSLKDYNNSLKNIPNTQAFLFEIKEKEFEKIKSDLQNESIIIEKLDVLPNLN